MKKIIFLTIVILSIVGCQKDDVENLVSFKIDGEQYICNSNVSSHEAFGNNGYPVLDLGGGFDFNPDHFHPEYIQIILWHWNEIIGEYPIDSTGESIITMYLLKNGGIQYFARSGKVVIEELSDGRIKGTFECFAHPNGANTGSGSITITEGKFDLDRGN